MYSNHYSIVNAGPQTHNVTGNLIIIAPLGVGIPIVCLCLVGTAAVVLYCLVIRRKRGKYCELCLVGFLTHTYTHYPKRK